MLVHKMYYIMWPEWRTEQVAMHLLYNHRHYLDTKYNETKEFNETNIYNYPNMTVRAMMLSALGSTIVP